MASAASRQRDAREQVDTVTSTASTERQVTIVNRLGLHARAASRLVGLAREFACSVTLSNTKREVDGKSIMSVMLLEAGARQVITIRTEGDDCDAALSALCELVARGFDEDTDYA